MVQVQAGCAGADRRAARGGLQVRQDREETASFLYDDHLRMLYISSISINSKCLACFQQRALVVLVDHVTLLTCLYCLTAAYCTGT
jgi:hypothetical protein